MSQGLRVLQGHPDDKAAPRLRPLTPRCPSWLDSKAKAEWRRVVPVLEAMGVLTEIDGAALAAYCSSYSLWRRCLETVTKEGLMTSGQRGVNRRHPLLIVLRQAEQSMRGFSEQFGMTPLSRERLSVAPDDGEPECGRCSMPMDMCGCG